MGLGIMAIATYIRSSSLQNWSYCENQWFLTYNLGYLQKANLKADMGTAVHKTLEWLAVGKKYLQDNPDSTSVKIDDMVFDRGDFYRDSFLSDEEAAAVTKSRASKSIYITDVSVKGGQKRVGRDVVNHLIDKASQYYCAKADGGWTKANFRDCNNWAWMALEFLDGAYDPRFRTVKFPEKHFDITLPYDWADYSYKVGDENISGKLAIKGTIDLITEVDSDTLEVVDWKTGARKNWATGERKEYEDLKKDKQLMLYYYALSCLFPEYKTIMISIFFIRDGGPFTVFFDKSHIPYIEKFLREHFEDVKSRKVPKMVSDDQSDFRCTRLCHYYKNNFPGTNTNICRFIHNKVKEIGIDNTLEQYKRKDFELGEYSAPGE